MELDRREWLEADGLGGYASGTASGIRTRRYHALLLASARPPTERFVLVNGMDVAVDAGSGWVPCSTQAYRGDVRHPEGWSRLESFEASPWPTWTYRVGDGLTLVQELLVAPGEARTFVRFRLVAEDRDAKAAAKDAVLVVRPFLSGRDYHALHFHNPHFRFESELAGGTVAWRPYDGVPGIEAAFDGEWVQEPLWYRRFEYAAETERGLEHEEDLASPGYFRLRFAKGEAALAFRALLDVPAGAAPAAKAKGKAPAAAKVQRGITALAAFRTAAAREARRRAKLGGGLAAAADAYIVQRGTGRTIVAGYPWFTDWGRDTFLAMRGLCLATGRLADAEAILLEWSGAVSEGMLPNRFPDRGEAPEFNSVDASLWYVVVCGEYLDAAKRAGRKVPARTKARLAKAVQEILAGYADGTRYGIRADADGLLAAGVAGQQLTWMDARVGAREITPRIGKPVEIQALWINALRVGAALGERRWEEMRARARRSFEQRFWNPSLGGLHDVVDADHEPGKVDAAVRPNQILAVGGLRETLLDGKKAQSVVDLVEDRLLTPLGLRTLAPDEPGYRPRYEGDAAARDGAYHQGTVWPWLLGPFVDAWLRVRGGGADAVAEARSRFLAPLEAHVAEAGVGHVSEVADGDPPHRPAGCPFQAWSVGEMLRIERALASPEEPKAPKAPKSVPETDDARRPEAPVARPARTRRR